MKRFKDNVALSEVIGRFCRGRICYGYVSYSTENLCFLLITRNKQGEELPAYFWELEQEEVEYLKSQGLELIPY